MNEDWLKVAERLYYYKNPETKMDVPSSVYETVNKWRIEWQASGSRMSLFDWCIENKK